MTTSDKERFDRLRLIRSSRIGPISYRQLIARFKSATAALDALPDLARRGGGKAIKIADKAAVEREIAATEKLGATFLFCDEPAYPKLLSQLSDAPAILILRGRSELLDTVSVAMVGARNASAAACKLAHMLAHKLTEERLTVVSGLARGIDTAAHRGALEGATIAVIAGGIDNNYPPENAKLQDEIAEKGLVVSEMPFGTEPRARHFPHRNRIIAGLSRGTVVVEAAPRSGSLITARLAGEAGREVMAIPGSPLDPRSRGCNGLIRDGATLVQSADDIIEAISGWNVQTGSQSAFYEPPLQDGFDFNDEDQDDLSDVALTEPVNDLRNDDRDRLENLLSRTFVSTDELIRQAALPVEVVQLALLEMELAGRLERGAGAKVRLAS